jgi:hypothetical protein
MAEYVHVLIPTLAVMAFVPIIMLLVQARDIKKKLHERLGFSQKPVPIPPFQPMLTALVIETMHKFHPKCEPTADLKDWREYVMHTADVFVETRAAMLETLKEEDPIFAEEDSLAPGTGAAIVMNENLTPEQKKQAEVRNWRQHGDVFRMILDMFEPFVFRHGYPTLERLGQEPKEYMRDVTKALDIAQQAIAETLIRHWPPQCPVEVMEAMTRPRDVPMDEDE